MRRGKVCLDSVRDERESSWDVRWTRWSIGVKLRLYARAGVAEVWLANVNTQRIEEHRRPSSEGYGESRVFELEESISVQAFPEVVFTVRELLG